MLLMIYAMMFFPMMSPKIMDDINIYRTQHHVQVMEVDQTACIIASLRAEEIIYHFSHDGFKSKVSLYKGYTFATENLAEGFDEKDVVQKWIESPTHEKNLLASTNKMCVIKKYHNGRMYYAMEAVQQHKIDMIWFDICTYLHLYDIVNIIKGGIWGIKNSLHIIKIK